MTTAQWYVVRDGAQAGPYSSTDLTEQLGRGEVARDTLVWRDGLSDWMPLATQPEFVAPAPHPASAPAPPPAPLPPALPTTPVANDAFGAATGWTPPPGVTDHSGKAVPPNLTFFAGPPAEIGRITSAWSTLERGKEPNPVRRRVIFAVVLGLLAGWIAAIFASLLGLILGMAIGGYLGFLLGSKGANCTYVGTQGVARYNWNKDPERMRRAELLLFRNAGELRTRQTRRYTNGVYTGTTYSYDWTDLTGTELFTLGGNHSSKEGTPKTGDPYYFGSAAEGAWSAFAFERAKGELGQNGTVRFNLTSGNFLVIGQGFIDVCMKGQTSRCATGEIARVSINQGVVNLRRTDAKSGFLGIGSSGIFTFNYADVGNARLFLFLLDSLVGVDFT